MARLGGKLVQNNLPDTHIIISSTIRLRVMTLPSSLLLFSYSPSLQAQAMVGGPKDIVKPEWLIACLESGELVPKEPKFLLYTSEATRKELEFVVDKYGDHFTRPTSPSELLEVFQSVCSSILSSQSCLVLFYVCALFRCHLPFLTCVYLLALECMTHWRMRRSQRWRASV